MLVSGVSCRKAVKMARKVRVTGKVAKKNDRESKKAQEGKANQNKEPLATYSLEHPNGYKGLIAPSKKTSMSTTTAGSAQVMSSISSKYAVKFPPHLLRDFRIENDGIEKRNIVLHYKYQEKTFIAHRVHDYLVSKGKYCFSVFDEEGKVSGLLPVDMIDKAKTGVAYQELGKFARYVNAEVKAAKGLLYNSLESNTKVWLSR